MKTHFVSRTFLRPTVAACLSCLIGLLSHSPAARAFAPSDSPAPHGTDVLIFADGEKLIGTLERSTGDTVVFKSNLVGEVSATWKNILELHVVQPFAVIPKGVRLRTDESDARIPQGTVSVVDGSLSVTPVNGPAQTIPLSATADLIDQQKFTRVVLRRPAWYENWKGAATVGLAVVNATQHSQTYTSAASFVRDIPGESWMDAETRTSLNFSSSFGQLTQPNTPEIKTSIFRAQAERDHYFTPTVFGFLNAQFDHDYSQGLDLQQVYSAGVGRSLIKEKREQLDLRAAVGYDGQSFFVAQQNQHLVGSIFSEVYSRTFGDLALKKAVLHQDLSITPSWSNLHAYSAYGNLMLTVPIIKRISFTTGIADTFLNNPSPNFRKNSFQFSSGVTYTRQ